MKAKGSKNLIYQQIFVEWSYPRSSSFYFFEASLLISEDEAHTKPPQNPRSFPDVLFLAY